MNACSENQEIKDLLWGTPMPIIAKLNSKTVMIRMKGSCSLIVTNVDLLQEKLPNASDLAPQARATLISAAIDAVIQISNKISSVEQLAKLTPKFSQLLKMKAMDGFAGLGLKIKELEIHAIEDGGAPPEGL